MTPGLAISGVATGIFGKLPARGDFVRLGLPRDFTDGWDHWLSNVMAETQQQAGDAWLDAFLQAPIWRFLLPPGLCGAGAALGLIMPSVDRVGRYFPLTLAAVARAPGLRVDPSAESWLDRCTEAGLAALENDAAPDDVRIMMGAPTLCSAASATSEWWTEGSIRVRSGRITLEELPSAPVLAAMLGSAPDLAPPEALPLVQPPQ